MSLTTTEAFMDEPRVLSIQSHVVHGYVGNRSAVFPMQLLGLEVDVLNTVHFSNHTGYKKFRGERMTCDQLENVIAGLEENDLLHYTHLLTGYIGNPALLRAITDTLRKLRRQNPSSLYVCDPVMGDDGKLYVSPELVDIYRDEVLPLADIITPNQFECELLSGQTLTSDADVVAACRMLHALGPRIVVVSSFTPPDEPHRLWLYASEAVTVNGRQLSNMYKMEVPRLPAYYSGTGDLFAALLLAWLAKHPTNLKLVLETVVATVQAVMRRTNDAQSANRELKLIQSRRDIESPTIVLKAQLLAGPITHVIWDARHLIEQQADGIAMLQSSGISVVVLIDEKTSAPSLATASSPVVSVSCFNESASWADVCAKARVAPGHSNIWLRSQRCAAQRWDVPPAR
ncbi:pyridoxal kinase, variant 1 [Aphanomyces invadans]|uniref:pyridoxal kinase n=1 Tax=Aphanomyces invadans TaxID=157072 RepID=A0A024US60_9STRA|nr:pyridoxal kinase, variant 1 [Aphanomyces invadans]ETW09169.1 pyridoxal kinase, variant 1 [Aphanomyces invadans]|eukprot:XP_008862975.1 pyridoxal kinase, variant 1 [Aphanomyces invadans]